MAESKIRVKHTQPFTTVFNSVLRDQRLSLKTLGLYVIMKSFPDDWEYSISGLAARCRIGRDAIRKCLKELEEAGYLLKEQGHQENGKFACNTYVLQDEAPPCTEKPYNVSFQRTAEVRCPYQYGGDLPVPALPAGQSEGQVQGPERQGPSAEHYAAAHHGRPALLRSD